MALRTAPLVIGVGILGAGAATIVARRRLEAFAWNEVSRRQRYIAGGLAGLGLLGLIVGSLTASEEDMELALVGPLLPHPLPDATPTPGDPRVHSTRPSGGSSSAQPPAIPASELHPNALTGSALLTYTMTNNKGVVGGLIPLDWKSVPEVAIPTAGMPAIGAAAESIVKIIKWGAGRPEGGLYPDSWTEPDGQMFELGALRFDGAFDVDVVADVYAGEWACRRYVWKGRVTSSTILHPKVSSLSPVLSPGAKPMGPRVTACLYQEGRYKDAGLNLTVVPRPAPRDVQLHAKVEPDGGAYRLALYLWMPPRLGQYEAGVTWAIDPVP